MYVVVIHPDQTLNVEAVGPYYTFAKAEQVCEQLSNAIDTHEVDEDNPPLLPQVVQLTSVPLMISRHARTPQ